MHFTMLFLIYKFLQLKVRFFCNQIKMSILRYGSFTLFVIVISFLVLPSICMYSPNYRKCILQNQYGSDLGALEIQRLPQPRDSHIQYHPKVYYRKAVSYLSDVQFIYHEFLGAGASGQAYLIEKLSQDPQNPKKTISTPKVIKRFFSQRVREFQEENFIMNLLGYPIEWTIDMDPERQIQGTDLQMTNKGPATIAIYPYYSSVIMREADVAAFDVPILLYKLCKQIEKAHSNGIIHDDMKLGNILIKIPDPNMNKIFDVQLIDWNLATFYYRGFTSNSKKGTPCYYSPQMLFRTNFITPQTDIFSLGVVIFYFLTDQKPYGIKCNPDKNNNIQAVTSLVGINNIIDMVTKYRYHLNYEMRNKINNMIEKPNKYSGEELVNLIPYQSAKYFDQNLIDLLEKMLIADPQQRITASQILEHEYFRKVNELPPMYSEKNKDQNSQKRSRSYDLDTLKKKVAEKKEREGNQLQNETSDVFVPKTKENFRNIN